MSRADWLWLFGTIAVLAGAGLLVLIVAAATQGAAL
jgi:hypothetical protein